MQGVLVSHLPHVLHNNTPGNLTEANYAGTWVGTIEFLLQTALSWDVQVIYTVCTPVSPRREKKDNHSPVWSIKLMLPYCQSNHKHKAQNGKMYFSSTSFTFHLLFPQPVGLMCGSESESVSVCVCVCVSKCLCICSQPYPFRLLIWEDAALSTCCEVAVNLEGVPRTALVWINPVLTWRES